MPQTEVRQSPRALPKSSFFRMRDTWAAGARELLTLQQCCTRCWTFILLRSRHLCFPGARMRSSLLPWHDTVQYLPAA